MLDKNTMLLAIIFFLAIPLLGMAQSHEVSGTVTDVETGETLPGVNIMIKGTVQGTTTDLQGSYNLSSIADSDTLIFSYVGYESNEIAVNGRRVIDVEMSSAAIMGDELVVVGYGSLREREISGSVSRVNPDEFDQNVSSSVDELLQGKAPGVQVVQNSGEPGGGMSIDIRGVGSINAGSSPLYVIDGLPIDNSVLISGTGNQVASNPSPRNPLSALNPQDIESIEVLKDASATAIYGSRGANGVILVTTKKGTAGDFQVNFNTQFGFQNVHQKLNLLNPQEYMEGINSLIDAGGGEESERVTEIIGGGTDWQDVIFRENAPSQKYNINFSWGNANTTYLVALNTSQQQGLVENTSFDRYGARFNLAHSTDNFNFGFNGNASYIKDKLVPNGFDVNLRGGAINAAKLWDPTRPIRDEDGNYYITELYDIDNPEAITTGNHIDGNRYRFFGTAYGEYFILPQLSAKVNVGGDFNNEDKSVYKDRTTIIGNSLGGVATAYEGTQSNYLVEGTLNFKESFENHTINAVLGLTTQRFLRRTSSMQANNFITDATNADNFSLADRSTLVVDSNKSSNKLLSYLGRINYTYLNKYIITASYRVDGSSRFGPGNKFGYFPSVSLGWLIDQEEFFSPLSDTFSMLKLRASWGKTGNQEIGNNRYLTTFNSGGPYVLDDQFTNSLNPSRIANPDLKWETTEQYNIGLDFSLLNDRFSGAIEWYQKDTYDMLLNLPIPTSSGYSSRLVNIGGMTNKGLEFALTSYNISGKEFSWSTDLNFSTLKNEVTDLGGLNQIFTGNTPTSSENSAIIIPGQPLRSFFGYEVTGIWQEGDDFSAVSNINNPGDFKFKDVNNDGIIDGDDRVILGNSFPDFSWGIGNTLSYKDFQFHFFFKGVHGISMINGNLLENYFPRSGVRVNRLAEPFLNRWTPENPSNDQPSYLNVNQLAQSVNSRTVVDASYIKLQTVRLSYNLSPDILKGLARSAEIYVSGQNLLTISDYEGFDPALNPNGNANFRVDWNGYPSATTYLIGVNLGF
ncbi:SusC/RagA family TonB-linked outer membrane protein [Rhodohalobacter sp. 614A]|uniref:SusC/RagA family TonB-linked outer membrane protein n=1 Tax=Rhodohalobacter sp. 614A TaxID=2908649 RepID=UPI001F480FBE|nr:TonB-dependent receptor [Rhodohalobacter sp. 614A]